MAEFWNLLTPGDKINLFIAALGAIATIAACIAARASQKAILTPLLMQMREKYTKISPLVGELADFVRDNDCDRATTIKAFIGERELASRTVKEEFRVKYNALNNARREVSQHFLAIMHLGKEKLVSDGFVKRLAPWDEARIFVMMMPIFEEAANPAYSKEVFEYFQDLWKFPPSALDLRQLGTML